MVIKIGEVVSRLPDKKVSRYKWGDTWVFPENRERLKESYYILKEKFQSIE